MDIRTLWILLGGIALVLILGGIAMMACRPRRRRPVTEVVAPTAAYFQGLAAVHQPARLLTSVGGMTLRDEDGSEVIMLPSVVLQDEPFYTAIGKMAEHGHPGSLSSAAGNHGSVGLTTVVKPREKKSDGHRRAHDERMERIERMVADKMATSSPVTVNITTTAASDAGTAAAATAKQTKTARAESPAPTTANEQVISPDDVPTK